MLKVEPFFEIMRLVLASAYIEGEKPLSAVFVAEPESGKTEIIRKYCLKTDGIFYTTDATAYGIIRDTNYLKDFEKGKTKHIVIPDLLTCMGRKETTVNTLISFFNSLIEEGVVDISTYMLNLSHDKEIKIGKKKKEVKAGLITSIATKPFLDKRYRWSGIGFMSRVLPISYGYTFNTRLEILDFIEKQNYLTEVLERLKFKKTPRDINLPYHYSKAIEPFSLDIAKAQDLYGFRLQKQFQVMLKSIAYLRNSDKVEQQDVDTFKNLVQFVNLDFNKV